MKFSRKLKIGLLGAAASGGDCFRDLMAACTLRLYNGAIPEKPEDAITTEVLLLEISGCDFASAAAYSASFLNVVLGKETATWTGTGEAAAGTGTTATWFRMYITAEAGSGTSQDSGYAYYRIDGTVGETSGYDLVMSDSTIISGISTTIDQFNIIIA